MLCIGKRLRNTCRGNRPVMFAALQLMDQDRWVCVICLVKVGGNAAGNIIGRGAQIAATAPAPTPSAKSLNERETSKYVESASRDSNHSLNSLSEASENEGQIR
jgi:hypothetical protein